MALRVVLGENPDVALTTVTQALAAQTFYRGREAGTCLDLKPTSTPLGGHADGIEDTAVAKKLGERHEAWGRQMPKDAAMLWQFVVSLDQDSRLALLAHCAALTVFAVRQPWDRTPQSWAAADTLAEAASLDMTVFWRPTARTYLGRVPKARILQAVCEAVSEDAAARMTGMKKQAMAEATEQL